MKVCPSIASQSMGETIRQFRLLKKKFDLAEVRIDHIRDLDMEKLLTSPRPRVIITNRRWDEGGKFRGTATRQALILSHALDLGAEYVDIELRWGLAFFKKFLDNYDRRRLICSYHTFQRTPKHLSAVYRRCRKTRAGIIKLATMANGISDNKIMFDVLRQARKDHQPIVGICMGEYGEATRIIGGTFGNCLTFGGLGASSKTGPGQLTVSDLNTIFHVENISSHTKIFGLIGNPVKHSRGIYFHNKRFHEKKLDAVYLNFLVNDLTKFWHTFSDLVTGLSVTMPLKERIIPFLDSIDPDVSSLCSINTIIKKKNKFIGYNTDYMALIDLLNQQTSLKGKQVLIMGTGGTARAMICAAVSHGAVVTALGRSQKKAESLAQEFSCQWDILGNICLHRCDILMNATSVGMTGNNSSPYSLVPKQFLNAKMIVLDAVYTPPITTLIRRARTIGCSVITGEELFERQASIQSQLFMRTMV